METNVNFVIYLPADMTSLVMQQLDDPADVVRAAAVSPAWRHSTILYWSLESRFAHQFQKDVLHMYGVREVRVIGYPLDTAC